MFDHKPLRAIMKPDTIPFLSTRVDNTSGKASITVLPNIPTPEQNDLPPRDWKFWCIILSLSISSLLAALEVGAIGTALPQIVDALHGDQFAWVGSAYMLAATALLPFSGGLAQAFGRRAIMITALILFAVGSALCGVSTNLRFLIAGRTIQGAGAGGIVGLTQIILSDLVPLRERGVFNGIVALAWALGTGIAPVVGGSLAQRGQWRWLFYLNIPICGVAGALTLIFVRLRTPPGSLKDKLGRIDWIGTCMVIPATTSVVIALTWGGIQHPWSSPAILVPLILGFFGLAAFIVFEAFVPRYPLVPFVVLSNRTSLSGYVQNFLSGLILVAELYYMPTYFQACQDATPTASGVDVFGLAYTVAPMGFVAGVLIQKTLTYRPQLWFGWALSMIGTGLLSTLDADSSRAQVVGFEILAGTAVGFLYLGSYFPVLASLPVTCAAPALAFYTFLRNFAQVWGITVGGTILQNELLKRLPSAFTAGIPDGTALAYSLIPAIPNLEEPLKTEVRVAFAGSLRVLWLFLTALSGLGLLASLVMKGLPLHTSVDEQWGRERSALEKQGLNAEKTQLMV